MQVLWMLKLLKLLRFERLRGMLFRSGDAVNISKNVVVV